MGHVSHGILYVWLPILNIMLDAELQTGSDRDGEPYLAKIEAVCVWGAD